jgi:hypothetical protein
MPETYVSILPAIINGAGGVLIAVVITQVFNLLTMNSHFYNKYRADIYNRRLALYEDIIKELDSMEEPHKISSSASLIEVTRTIREYVHTLRILFDRLCIYGSPKARKLLFSFIKQLRELLIYEDVYNPQEGVHYRAELHYLVENTMRKFTKLVSLEIRTAFSDIRKISWYTRCKQIIHNAGRYLNRKKNKPS